MFKFVLFVIEKRANTMKERRKKVKIKQNY